MQHFDRPPIVMALLFAACTGCDFPPANTPDLVLANVTVIDGLGSAPRPHQTIEVTSGRITALRTARPEDVGTIDAAGSFVTPGLIDSHQHIVPRDVSGIRTVLDSLLGRGITSAREMACCAADYAEFVASADTSQLTRLYWSAFWAGPTFMRDDPRVQEYYAGVGSAPWLLAVTDTTNREASLLGARESGATGLKIYSDLPPRLMTAVAASAKEAGMRVWSHPVVFPTPPSVVAASGVDVISHAALFVWEGAAELPATYNGSHPFNPFGPPAPYASVRPDGPAVTTVLESMRDRGLILDATVATIAGSVGEEASAWAVELTRHAHDLGIRISTGTDGVELFDEIEMLVESVGLTPLEVIASATSIGAAVIGVTDDYGSVEVGKVADLVIYEDDPSVDVAALRRPSSVVRGGRLVRPRY
jgi:imidazolonepropionase-like amidohydrolase